jgi:hypothetical protein
VEIADAQALEGGVKRAIDQFVRGCKKDGIWDAIKASCILAGARTLAGALVPLKGTAPTNNGPFVSGDYNRETGLVGNGSTKYLDSNRLGNADPTLNAHMSAYVSSGATDAFSSYLGSSTNQTFGISGGFRLSATSFRGFNNVVASVEPIGLAAVKATAGNVITARYNGTDYTGTGSSVPPARPILVFGRTGPSSPFPPGAFSNARLAFYSIGESLDLALLDTRVSALITAIGVAI